MFDPRSYHEACDRMTLSAEKIEEMIAMTENTSKKTVRRPARVALLAAAVVAALGITASAAELPAVQEFFATIFVTVASDGAGLNLPSVAVEEREGRSILLVDGEEILKSNYFTYSRVLWERARDYRDEQGLNWREAYLKTDKTVLDDGLFDQRDFYAAFQEFDNQSVEASLSSENPIVRIFALLDRRLGKRRLAALEETMGNELDWVRPFYLLRMEAEGLNLQKEKEVC